MATRLSPRIFPLRLDRSRSSGTRVSPAMWQRTGSRSTAPPKCRMAYPDRTHRKKHVSPKGAADERSTIGAHRAARTRAAGAGMREPIGIHAASMWDPCCNHPEAFRERWWIQVGDIREEPLADKGRPRMARWLAYAEEYPSR